LLARFSGGSESMLEDHSIGGVEEAHPVDEAEQLRFDV